jgi:hypothetical protein
VSFTYQQSMVELNDGAQRLEEGLKVGLGMAENMFGYVYDQIISWSASRQSS